MKNFIAFIGFTMVYVSCLFAQNITDLPQASIAGKIGTLINKDSLLAAGNLDCSDPHFIVTSFTLTKNEGTDLVSYKSSSRTLTPVMIKSIINAPSGTKLFFEDIMVTSADGVTLKLKPLTLKLE